MNWIKIGGYVLIILPTLFIGIVIGFYLIQDYMIFLGEKLPLNHKYNFKAPFEELNFNLPGGHTINALLFRSKESRGLIFYHHGNAGNLQSWGNFAPNFLRLNFDVLFYDYRGYGKSTGKIKKQHHLINDAAFIYNEIKRNNEYNKIIFYGNSLGTGIASKLAVMHRPDALILESPYFNFCDLVHYHYPYLPSKIMSKYKLRTDKFIVKIDCPIMLLHGTDDKIVPYNSSVRLSEIKNGITFITIKNGVHNNLPEFELYHKELDKFLKFI